MDFSQQEFPLTAYFSRTHKKKDNVRPTRSTTKRKHQATEVPPTKNEKGVVASSSKDLLNTSTSLESNNASGRSHRSVATRKASRASADEKASHEVLDLTSPSPERQASSSASKRRRLDVAGVALPTPPSTHTRKFHIPQLPIAERQRTVRGALPTPATSVPRRPMDRVVQTPSSPLAPRPCAAKARLRSSSPLSSCPSDDDAESLHGIGARSHADVAQALRNVAPCRPDKTMLYEAEGDGRNNMFANSAAGEILVPSSPPPSKDMPPPSISYAPRRRGSSNGLHIDTSPVITSITNLPYLTMEPTTVESSQSQALLPFQDSPRRNRILPVSLIPSSQSQILLPFWDSPRRQQRIFTPNARHSSGADMDETVPSSQSQDRDEMYMGMNLSQLGLHELPTFHDGVDDEAGSQTIDVGLENGSSLPESFPLTPRNKRAARWRELNLSPEKRPGQSDECRTGDVVSVYPNRGEIKLPDSHGLKHANDIVEDLTPSKSIIYPRDSIPPSPPHEPVEDCTDGDYENSLSFQSAPNFSSQYNHTFGSSLSEDTQALMLAGAPPGSSQSSGQGWGIGLSDESIPSVVRDFIGMFDDDDGSYPADFPAHLRC